jgi:TPR repeat protein
MALPRGKAAVSGLLFVAGILALAAALVWIRGALQPAQNAKPAATSPAVTMIDRPRTPIAAAQLPVPAASTAAPDAAAFRERVIRRAVSQRFVAPALPPEAERELAAGRVAVVAQLLQSLSTADAAVLESRLLAVCEEVAGSGGDSTASVAAVGAVYPIDSQTTESYRAQREWLQRLRPACTATHFDTAGIRQRLETHAAAGHAASLWELAQRAEGEERTRRTLSAALLGSAPAQLRLAAGSGGALTPSLAMRLSPTDRLVWLKSAAASFAPAQLQYARCLTSGCEGLPVEPDPIAAKSWYERAAHAGSPAAILALASGADGNSGVNVSDSERYAWSQLGAVQSAGGCFGFDTGLYAGALATARDAAERALRPAEQTEARALAQQLLASLPCKP